MTGAERNVALLCLDSVRADAFREFAPRLRERAAVEYTQCRAVSGWSVPAHASMFTGRLPHQHGFHAANQDFSGLARSETFLGDLPNHRAVGASANLYASSTHGFDRLFDSFVDASPNHRFPEGIDVRAFGLENDRTGLGKHAAFLRAALAHDHPLASLANGAVVQLSEWSETAPVPKLVDDGADIIAREARRLVGETPANEPYFLFTNFMDAHWPLTPVRGYDRSIHGVPLDWSSKADLSPVDRVDDPDALAEPLERYRRLYDAAVDYLDRVVADLVDDLLAGPGETTVVVTADHGENLGTGTDERLFGHKGSMTEGLLHVPLLVVNPPGDPGSEQSTIEEYASLVDLPTLLVGLAGGEVPSLARERVLAERVGSNLPRHLDPDGEEAAWWNRMTRIAYEGGRKYQWDSTGDRRVYELDPDRPNWQAATEETFDPEPFEADFEVPLQEYKQRAEADARDHEVDEATSARLEHLGYR